ncbi:hypothetical protein L0156_19935 [bacterium]|nr:hypothetical protein [bacterium]
MNFGNFTTADFGYDTKKRLKEIIFRNGQQTLFDGIGVAYNDANYKTSRTNLSRGNILETFTYTSKLPAQLKESNKLYPQGSFSSKPNFSLLSEKFDQDNADRINRYIEADLPKRFEFDQENQPGNILDEATQTALANHDYDANGNQIEKRYGNGNTQRRIQFDFKNLPVTATTFSSSGQQTNSINYTYDALGRRIIKAANGQKTRYVNFGKDIIQERDGNSDQETFSYVYQGIDRPVAMFRNTTDPTNRTLFYATDDNGNVTSLTNESGQVVERYYYKAYGDFRVTADTEPPQILRVKITTDGSALEFDFSEEMTNTALSSVLVNDGALTGTASFLDAEKTKMRWAFGQNLPQAGEQIEIRVTETAQDLSLRSLTPFRIFANYTAGAEVFVAAVSDLYTGEKIHSKSTVDNLLTFQGARYEPELRMYYLRARLLDTETFQFISVDPEHYGTGPNLYAFAHNNPLSLRDSEGTDAGALQALPDDLHVEEWKYINGYDNGDPIGRMALQNRDIMSPDENWPSVLLSTTSHCAEYGRDHRTMFNCTTNALEHSVSWSEADAIAARIANRTFPQKGNSDHAQLAQGILQAKAPVDMMGAGLELFFTAVVPVAFFEGAPIRLALGNPILATSNKLPMLHLDSIIARNYQRYYNDAWLQTVKRFNEGEFPIHPSMNWETILGQEVDAIARARLRNSLPKYGIFREPGPEVMVNRRLYDPSGSGKFRVPDLRLNTTRRVFDGTIGDKLLTDPQPRDFHTFTGGYKVEIIRPRVGPKFKK